MVKRPGALDETRCEGRRRQKEKKGGVKKIKNKKACGRVVSKEGEVLERAPACDVQVELPGGAKCQARPVRSMY